jgi:signal peptidase I
MTASWSARSTPIRYVLYCLIVLGTAWLARSFLIQGLLLPVRVHGGSMAPSLLGRHFVQACPACRYSFPFDEIPDTGIVCPNCGFIDRRDEDNIAPRLALPGERVLLDRLSLRLRSPRRWEVVAFRRPDGQHSVKRVVGLPGESVEIRGGDIWVDGQVVRKPLPVLQSMMVPVYSDRYRATDPKGDTHELRWRSDGALWKSIPDGYWLPSTGTAVGDTVSPNAPITFLTYQHLGCLPLPVGRSKTPVLDSYGFNQNLSRSLQPVTDLLLRGNIRWLGNGTIVLRFWSGQHLTEIQWPVDGPLVISNDGRQTQVSETQKPRGTNGTGSIFLGYADGRAFLAVDERIVIEHRCQTLSENALIEPGNAARQQPFSIGGSGLELRVTDLQLSRDIHYLQIPGQTDHWRLQDDQFLLLGDNSPISEDARYGPDYGVVTADQMLGRLIPQPSG